MRSRPLIFSFAGLILGAIFATVLGPSSHAAAQDHALTPAYVIIDRSEPAFTVFTGIPSGTSEDQFAQIRSDISKRGGASIVTWAQFKAQISEIAKSTILRDEYPNYRAVEGLTCLIERQPGSPWGLTWNGGIALTFMDYQHARAAYRMFKAHPENYHPIRDPRADPTNPGGFLPAFGCM